MNDNPCKHALLERLSVLPHFGEFRRAASDLACHDHLDETLLVFEATEDGHARDAGAACDIVDGGPSYSEVGELGQCGGCDTVEQFVAAGLGSRVEDVDY